MAVSVGAMELTLSIAIVQVATSVAIMQALRFFYNYAGDYFCCNKVSAALMLVRVSAANR